MRAIVLFLLIVGLMASNASAEDGTFDAMVTTESGTYSVPVEVEGGEVTTVYWPNGGDMSVYGADISGTEASGSNSRGESVSIELEGYEE